MNTFDKNTGFRNLRIIYLSLITGVTLFLFVILLQMEFDIPPVKKGLDILNVLSILFLLTIPLGATIFKRKVSNIDDSAGALEKLSKLQAAYIFRWAMIEGPALFALVTFLLLVDGKQLIVFLICILAFFFTAPDKEKFKEEAKLTAAEKAGLPEFSE